MKSSHRAAAIAVFGLLALAASPASAQATDPGDLAFWQTIQNSTNPAEYKAYLEAYPNGRFAGIAKIRAITPPPAPGGQAQPAVAPIPLPAPEPDPSDPAVTITPASGRVGALFVIGCVNIPENNYYKDRIVVVRVGTPVMDPTLQTDMTKIVWSGYPQNCKSYNNTLPSVGPFAPGTYEVRYMTGLFNDAHDMEAKAKVTFTVR